MLHSPNGISQPQPGSDTLVHIHLRVPPDLVVSVLLLVAVLALVLLFCPGDNNRSGADTQFTQPHAPANHSDRRKTAVLLRLIRHSLQPKLGKMTENWILPPSRPDRGPPSS